MNFYVWDDPRKCRSWKKFTIFYTHHSPLPLNKNRSCSFCSFFFLERGDVCIFGLNPVSHASEETRSHIFQYIGSFVSLDTHMGSTSGIYHIQVPPDISKTSWFETACHSFDRGKDICENNVIGLDSIKSQAKWMAHISAVKIPQCPGNLKRYKSLSSKNIPISTKPSVFEPSAPLLGVSEQL
jgi:hypothetical protein